MEIYLLLTIFISFFEKIFLKIRNIMKKTIKTINEMRGLNNKKELYPTINNQMFNIDIKKFVKKIDLVL